MPEFPEVHTIVEILNEEIKNKTIKSVDVLYNGTIKSDLSYFIENLKDKTFNYVTQIGKFIIFHLSDNYVLISHLRMEGKYSLLTKDDINPPHSCVVFNFYDDSKLVYFDTRKFGIMILDKENEYKKHKPIFDLGPNPFEITEDNINLIYKKFIKNKPIKELLMNQNIVCGIGNIYADESLYLSKINPLTKGKDLTFDQIKLLLNNSKLILEKAIKLGGSTIKSYHPKEGIDGRFQEELICYGHKGDICPNCGTKFHKIYLNGRGTTFCPNCQINPDLKKAIGITGIIGSGKSTILDIFKEKGFTVLSCDLIVKELYQDQLIKFKVNALFDKNVLKNNKLDFNLIKHYIQNNEVLHEKLEDLLFPYVEDEIIKSITEHKNETIVVEVPLLFKAHMQYLFKNIIIVKSDMHLIKERLLQRGLSNPEKEIDFYLRNHKFEYENENIYFIENNDDLSNLHKQIDLFIKSLN